MRAWRLPAGSDGFGKLYLEELPDPTPGPGEVLNLTGSVGVSVLRSRERRRRAILAAILHAETQDVPALVH